MARESRVDQVGGLATGDSRQRGKRFLDLALSVVLGFVCLPVLVLVALAVKLEDGGPVLYRQRRVGFEGRVFEMIKFRSMVAGADKLVIELRDRNVTDGLLFKVEGDPRVTRVGQVIRRLSLDELPQLWNVLVGQMSLVGPRPLPVDPQSFGPVDGRRHSVRPGITGRWQTSGGNRLGYWDMVKLDLDYIHNWSLWHDCELLIRTLPALLARDRLS